MFTRIYKLLKTFMIVGSIATSRKVSAPILVTKDGVLLDGNTRLRLAKQLGLKEIPVVFIDSKVEQVDPNTLKESY